MNLARLEIKNAYQCLFIELLEDYGLSQIESRALVKRVEQFQEEMHDGRQKNNQIIRQAVADELKRCFYGVIIECKLCRKR